MFLLFQGGIFRFQALVFEVVIHLRTNFFWVRGRRTTISQLATRSQCTHCCLVSPGCSWCILAGLWVFARKGLHRLPFLPLIMVQWKMALLKRNSLSWTQRTIATRVSNLASWSTSAASKRTNPASFVPMLNDYAMWGKVGLRWYSQINLIFYDRNIIICALICTSPR